MTKRVPLERLRDMAKQRSMRRGYWPAVPATNGERPADDEEAGNGDR